MSDHDFQVRSLFRDYTVSFVDDVVPHLAPIISGGSFVVIDSTVLELHGARLRAVLDPERMMVVEATEEKKTLDGCRNLIETLVDRGFRRDGKIVAIGGGIIQDIAAFSASVLYRGVEWIFVPTTLLAQADSCIGSKTSINLGDKKNLLGNFYPPGRILIDRTFLETLVDADIRSGIGEMLHFYYFADSPKTADLYAEYDRLLAERWRIEPYVRESLQIKKSVAERDEFDRGERNKFNYGHTFGHALESATRYEIRHGLAVTVGMDLANYLSLHLGRMSAAQFNDMHRVLRRNMPDYDLSRVDIDRYLTALSKDKKNVARDLVCILASRPGHLEKVRLPMDADLRRKIEHYYRNRVWAMDQFVPESI